MTREEPAAWNTEACHVKRLIPLNPNRCEENTEPVRNVEMEYDL